jgi:ubiquinol-cytochrome c reductase cytochrome b subunit/menaquinol-cytochrome c reductase cytochrome b/c subunit
MNAAEKEAYLREYSLLKNEGKPFFPYIVAKDAAMAVIVMTVIIFLSLIFGAELGPKADPTTTTYVPRPEWYFFFLFEVLRVIKPPILTPLATIGVPTICMILLFLLPFYDRSPERRIERRPVALATGLVTIFAVALLTYQGASAGSPNSIDMKAPAALTQAEAATFNSGKLVAAQSGCLACHVIGDNGNNGPGPPLTHIASKLAPAAIASTLVNPTAPMPSFKSLATQSPQKFSDLVGFLSELQ